MSAPASVAILAGAVLSALAGVGLLRLRTPFGRLHAAGKASPAAFLLVASGAAIETGWAGAARLLAAAGGLLLTVPVGVHLLFRAVHRVGATEQLSRDDLSRKDHNQ
ncbi:MAG: monovalent cation/H(+) antiporter subunit G [Acidimicrobiia bacterium]|nr:monovalent cation/H(+) antiporter subunit G [Acidimicrobiia bacterium]